MHVFHRLEEIGQFLKGKPRSAVAIGNFDGVHLGHRAILGSLLESAKGGPSVVLTFFPHPVEVLQPGVKLLRLTTTEEKLSALEASGVDSVLVVKFDTALSTLSPEAFVEIYLSKGLQAASLHVGFNFMFGRRRAGNIQTLRESCARYSMELREQPAFLIDGERVSSSAIRELLSAGDMEKAAKFLGRPYAISGAVVSGESRGKGLGFPTANLKVSGDKILPKTGVYLTRTTWQRQTFRAVTNVGVRPTFGEGLDLNVETHLIDFQAKLYDEQLTLEFISRLRDERKFPSIDALKAQIAEDVAAARATRVAGLV